MIYKSIFAKDLFILVLPDPISSKTYLFQYLKANADLNTILRRPMQTVMASCLSFALLFFYAWMQHMRAKAKNAKLQRKSSNTCKSKSKCAPQIFSFSLSSSVSFSVCLCWNLLCAVETILTGVALLWSRPTFLTRAQKQKIPQK